MKNGKIVLVIVSYLVIIVFFIAFLTNRAPDTEVVEHIPSPFEAKLSSLEALKKLKTGNDNFVNGKLRHAHLDAERLLLASRENQADHAYATVITCSDSRVPVEAVFDAGVMDIFVVRVAGNVCDTDEVGSIEYGLAHVYTPVFVVLGHTQCGAVTAVANGVLGHGHKLEANIPPLVDNIEPAVRRAMKNHPDVAGTDIIPYAIIENVWQGVEDLFMKSPAARRLVREGYVKVVGAVYDVGTGRVNWLDESGVLEILNNVDENQDKVVNEFYTTGEEVSH